MEINQNVYGSETSWINAVVNYNDNPNKNKLANFKNDASAPLSQSPSLLWQGVSQGKLAYGTPIDPSLSYCGLGTESAMSHTCYVGYNNGVDILRSDDRSLTNFAFFERRKYGNYIPSEYDVTPITDLIRRSQLNQKAWTDTMVVGSNFCVYNSPITKINPKNLCLLLQVYAGTSSSGGAWIDFDSFANTSTYTHIGSARFIPYMSDNGATGRTPNAQAGSPDSGEYNFFINLLEDYNFPEWDFSANFYSYVNNIIFGNLQSGFTGYYSTNNDMFNILYLTDRAKDHVHISTEGQPSGLYNIYLDRYEGIEEDILKTVACFGLYFTTKSTVAVNGTLTDHDMYIGILDRNGIGHGEYLRGAATAQAPQNEYDDMHNVPYDPSSADTTHYVNDTLFYGTWSSQAFTKMYVLTAAEVASLANELYTAVSLAPQGEEIERYNQSVFLTQNPIDCIISLKKFPMELPFSASVPIKLGSYTCDTTGAPLLYTTGIYSFSFSRSIDNTLKAWFEDSFLDYEPYTKVELTIPFCGTVEIPCCYIYEYDTIDIKLVVDFITGACTAYILSRNITIDSVSGECAVNMPVNGVQSATLDSQIHSSAMSRERQQTGLLAGLIAGAAAIGIGIATGGVGTAIGGAAAIVGSFMKAEDTGKEINYELSHMQVPLKQISAASGAIAQSYDMRCKMRITRPVIDPSYDAAVYADTIGYACLLQGEVKDFTGLTAGEIDLDGVAAPETVKRMIQNLFAEGVYL